MHQIALCVLAGLIASTGCFGQPEACSTDSPSCWKNWGEGSGDEGGGGNGYQFTAPAARVRLQPKSCGTGSPIAVGGSDVVTLARNDASEIDVTIEGAGRLSIVPSPNEYGVVDAIVTPIASGPLALVVTSDLATTLNVPLSVDEVRDVQLIPPTPYDSATDHFAYLAFDTNVVVALRGAPSSTGTPRCLVDASVEIATPGFSQVAWDTFELTSSPASGTYAIDVRGDSFGARTYEIELVDSADRIEGTVTRLDATWSRVCFHAYLGTREVFMDYEIEHHASLVSGGGGANCVTFHAQPGYRYPVTARSPATGLEATVEVVGD